MTTTRASTSSTQEPAIREIDASEVRDWLTRGEAALVDVREPDEHAREHIEGSTLIPASRFSADALPAPGPRLVLHCKSGMRAAETAARAIASGISPVYTLKGGIEAWKRAGLPVVNGARLPISLLRQMQITAGSLILAFSILAFAVSPWFIAGTAFMGAGLLFAGLSGTCAMVAGLSYMPWNAGFRAACSPKR